MQTVLGGKWACNWSPPRRFYWLRPPVAAAAARPGIELGTCSPESRSPTVDVIAGAFLRKSVVWLTVGVETLTWTGCSRWSCIHFFLTSLAATRLIDMFEKLYKSNIVWFEKKNNWFNFWLLSTLLNILNKPINIGLL